MIESLQNAKVKEWNKLKRKKDRMKSKTFLIEGEHVIEEAIKSNWNVKEVIVQADYKSPLLETTEEPITVVSKKVLEALSSTENPQGIMAEVHMNEPTYSPSFQRVLMLDAIQDPGNVGTMIRTADAFQFDAVIFGAGTVDLYNEKVVRATQGSIFHIPIFSGSIKEWAEKLKEDKFSVWATALQNGVDLSKVLPPDKVAVIFGNEGSGVQGEHLELCDHRIYIPITGLAESLNVSVASGIIIHYLRL
jgi:RNA methyltransferase, TrmH family